jgi:glycosyltransferase involved in cell wall biosynthesis
MRILFLLTQDLESPSGLGRYLPLTQELVKAGHQVQIAALHSNFEKLAKKRLQINGVEVHYVAPMHVMKSGDHKSYYRPHQLAFVVLRATLALSWAAFSTQTDLIFIGKPHPMNSIAGLLAKIFRRIPLVIDCDDYEAAQGNFTGRWQKKVVEFFEKRVPRMATAVTTHTYYMRDNLVSWGVHPDKITYLPNGVDPDRFTQPDPERIWIERKRLGLDQKKVIAYIGSLSMPSHPVYLLIEAFAQLKINQSKNIVLLIVGGGEDKTNLQSMATELGISDITRFTGRVPPEDISLYYALADVSIDPILDDPAARGRSPLKLFESWICGVPFVSADVGERSYLIGDPPAGVLVSADQEDALVKGITQVLSNQDFAKTLIDRGKERVKKYYWSALVQTIIDLFTTQQNTILNR